MIYHLVCGEEAARPLQEAISAEPAMAGEIIVLRDDLQTGPLQRAEGQSFKSLRSEWWQQMAPAAHPAAAEDLERLLELSNAMNRSASATAWFWLAPCPTDACAYTWMLSVLGRHIGRLFVLNIANLPFLDENGKVFYPEKLRELQARELIKARRLARPVTASELEMEHDTWARLVAENGMVRTLGAGRKLKSEGEDYYDAALLSGLTAKAQKASRLLHQATAKEKIPVSDSFLAWRLRVLGESGLICLNADRTRPYKEWEVALAGVEETAPEEQEQQQ